MNRLILYLAVLLLLLFSFSVDAVNNKVIVLNLHYDDGNITLLNSTIKYGFSPDYRYQPDYGYRLQIISVKDVNLYEFKFKVPNEVFIDGTNASGDLSGGKLVFDNINFALTAPYYNDMKEIRIYSPEERIAGKISFKQEAKIGSYIIGVLAAAILIIILFIFLRYRKHNS